MQQLPDWMYHSIEESFACQFTSVAANGTPVGLPVILNHFNPDAGTLIISSPTRMKRLENVRRHPEVAMLFSPVGTGKGEPPHVLLVQGRAEVDDADPENGWRRYFAGWARRHPRMEKWQRKMKIGSGLCRLQQQSPLPTYEVLLLGSGKFGETISIWRAYQAKNCILV